MLSFTEENYLKALFNLAQETGEVSVSELSDRLGIKMPTVTSMMKALARKGLVIYESYKPIKLSEEGRREAGQIIRKHRLTEMFLVEKMGFGWENVHEIAEQVEHIHAPEFFEKMDELLGYPRIDPHGSPIPDKDGAIPLMDYIKLRDCKAGETVKVAAVMQTSTEFLTFLNRMGIGLGTAITIAAVEPFDGSMQINYQDHQTQTISHTVSERLLVERQS